MSKKIVVSDLEFDDIKNNLKEFMSVQPEFTDYNFEGSALSVLLDVLAYNTHYNALYDNMMVNESFLDSAVKRDSVVSRATDLGYVPRSAKCSKVYVNLSFGIDGSPEDPPANIVIEKYSPFVSNSSNASYTFYNPESIILKRSGVNYVANDVLLLAGAPSSFSFIYENENTRFVIPNQNVDVDTLKVNVFESSSQSSKSETYTRADTVMGVTSTSKVYWIKEIESSLYELKFGNDILGKALVAGNTVNIRYMTSYGTASNSIRSLSYSGQKRFTYSGSLDINLRQPVVTLLSPSYSGDNPESIESIKFNAPRSFSTQNRAVTVDDYKSIILSQYPEAQSVTVWGGEDNYPPEYGKVFICVSQQNFKKLSPSQRNEITNILRTRKVVSVTPVILDTEYIELLLDVSVYYNERETIRSEEDIKTFVLQNIYDYNENTLEKFDGIFRYSRLSRIVDDSESSIVNSNTYIKMRREVIPKYDTVAQYVVNLINPIKRSTFASTGFYIDTSDVVHYLDDDGNGNVRLYYYSADKEKIIKDSTIGTIDYDNGLIIVDGLFISSIVDMNFKFIMEPNSRDIVSALNQIVRIVEDEITVTVYPDKTAIGDLRAGQNYNFT